MMNKEGIIMVNPDDDEAYLVDTKHDPVWLRCLDYTRWRSCERISGIIANLIPTSVKHKRWLSGKSWLETNFSFAILEYSTWVKRTHRRVSMTYQLEDPKNLISQCWILLRVIINNPLLRSFLPLKNRGIRLLPGTSPSLPMRVNTQRDRRATGYPSVRS